MVLIFKEATSAVDLHFVLNILVIKTESTSPYIDGFIPGYKCTFCVNQTALGPYMYTCICVTVTYIEHEPASASGVLPEEET